MYKGETLYFLLKNSRNKSCIKRQFVILFLKPRKHKGCDSILAEVWSWDHLKATGFSCSRSKRACAAVSFLATSTGLNRCPCKKSSSRPPPECTYSCAIEWRLSSLSLPPYLHATPGVSKRHLVVPWDYFTIWGYIFKAYALKSWFKLWFCAYGLPNRLEVSKSTANIQLYRLRKAGMLWFGRVVYSNGRPFLSFCWPDLNLWC